MKFTLEEFLAYKPQQPTVKILEREIILVQKPKRKISLKESNRKYTRDERKVPYVASLKENACCSVCQKHYPRRVLDFHHVRFPKVATISRMEKDNRFSLEELIDEVNKCVIVCSNCHRQSH